MNKYCYPKFSGVSLILSVFLFLTLSCKDEKNEILTINPTFNIEKCEISLIAEDIKYIPLITDTILGSILKVEYSNHNFLIKDNKQKLMKFNDNGQNGILIGNKGKGPNEFVDLCDFTIDYVSNKIYVLVRTQKKINIYSFEGEFIGTIKLGSNYPYRAEFNEKLIFICYDNSSGSNKTSFEVFNLDGIVLKQYPCQFRFKSSSSQIMFSNECIFYTHNDKVHVKEIHSDTVYYFEDLKLKAKYILNSSKYGFKTKFRSNVNQLHKKGDKLIIHSNLLETKKFIFYEYNLHQTKHYLIFHKQNFTRIEFNGEEGLYNDIDCGPNFFPQNAIDQNTLIGWVDAYRLKDHVTSKKFISSTPKYPEKKKELEKLADSLSENDNPVLMLVKLKE